MGFGIGETGDIEDRKLLVYGGCISVSQTGLRKI